MLLPFPVFIALFQVLEKLTRKGTVVYQGVTYHVHPKYLTHGPLYVAILKRGGKLEAFAFDIAKSAATAHGSFWSALPYYVLLLIIIATQYYHQPQLTSPIPPPDNHQ